jgi:Uncharacterized protein conserved in bacteria
MTRPVARVVRGAIAVAVATLIGVTGFASPASAHVTVDPREAVQGGFSTVVFRMPNERDNASTTKLEVHMPTENPVPSVRTMDVPGWKVSVKMRKLDEPIDMFGRKVDEVVGTLTWTAASKKDALSALEFVQFPVSMGPLPKTDQLVFKAIQTYDNGEVVRWIEEPAEDGEEPEHPAPVLTLAEVPAEDGGDPAQAGTPAGDKGAEESFDSGSGGTPLWLGIAGLVAGLIGLALGALALNRTRAAAAAGPEPDSD